MDLLAANAAFSGPGDFQKPKTPQLTEETIRLVTNTNVWRRRTRELLTLAIPTVSRSCKDLIDQLETQGLLPTDLPFFDCLLKAGRMISHYKCVLEIHARKLEDIDPTIRNHHFDRLQNVINNPEKFSKLLGCSVAYAKFGLMEKYLKWSTATLWATVLEQKELPPTPEFPIMGNANLLFYGSANRIFWQNLNTPRLRKLIGLPLAKDLYMSKAASMPVPRGFVEESLKKHKKILCEEKEFDPLCDNDENEEILEEIEEAIVRSVQEIFGPIKANPKKEIRCPSRIPSLGSSFEFSRKKGGAFGELVAFSDLGTLPQPVGGYLFGFARNPEKSNWNYFSVCEVRVPNDPEIYFEAERASRFIALEREQVNATVIPLTEAFKVRTITKGDAHMYHLARRWQKPIHDRMRKHPSCSLIGKPCSSAFLSQVFGNSTYFDRSQNGFFVSGDYESATDLLNPYLSEFAQEAIGQAMRIPLEDRLVLKKCLTKHALSYGEKDVDGCAVLHPQQWGQLMGSPTSFPVLCLINLAITRLVYEIRYQKEIPLCELPICVNGDDVLFWAPDEEFYETWKSLTGLAGLKFSLGKNYTHKSICIINSEMYYYLPNSPSNPYPTVLPLFKKAPTVNSQLLVGGNRSSAVSAHWSADLPEDELRTYLSTMSIEEIQSYIREICPRVKDLSNKRTQLSNKACLIQGRLRESNYVDGADLDEWARWFNTIEQRQGKLQSMWLGDAPRSNLVKMQEEILKTFRKISLYRVQESRFVTKNLPNYLPQSIGGLGLIPPENHVYSPLDFLHVSACAQDLRTAEQWGRRLKPIAARSPFMNGVCGEIAILTAILEIRKVREYSDNEDFRYGGEEDLLWSSRFLSGFMSLSPAITAEETAEQMSEFRKDVLQYPRALQRQSHRIMQVMRREGDGVFEKRKLVGGLEGWKPLDSIPEDLRIASHYLRPEFC